MPLYFGLKKPIAATADILALGGTLAYLTNVWGQIDPVCGWLLAPYLGWVGFATYLCVSISTDLIMRHTKLTVKTGWVWPSQQLGL